MKILTNTKEIPRNVTIDDFFDLLLTKKLDLDKQAKQRIKETRTIIEMLGDNNIPIYGVNTGFGEMINRLIPKHLSGDLQKNLIRTHVAGMGDPLHPFIVRAIMLCRIITFSKGYSGISLKVVQRLINYLNSGIYPFVHCKGSLGASGDLSPLSEIALALIGEGYTNKFSEPEMLEQSFVYDGITNPFNPVKTQESLKDAPIFLEPTIDLSYKEGLSLINGTAGMTGIGIITYLLAKKLYYFSIIATCLSLVALQASSMPFDMVGVRLKGHSEMEKVALDIRTLLRGAGLIRKQEQIITRLKKDMGLQIKKSDEYLQNAYSLRVIPQVLGGFVQMLIVVKNSLENELNGVDDNPIVIPKGQDQHYVFHGANFHGQQIAYVMDWLKLPVIQLAQLADRRIARLIDNNYNDGLPDLLAPKNEGLSCGFEGLQYASTSIVAEMKSLSTPASIQSIPSNLNNQDLVSMGMIASRQTLDLVLNAITVISVEIRTALQAIELRIRKNIENGKDFEQIAKVLLGRRLYNIYDFFVHRMGCRFAYEDKNLSEEVHKIEVLIKNRIFTKEDFTEFLASFLPTEEKA